MSRRNPTKRARATDRGFTAQPLVKYSGAQSKVALCTVEEAVLNAPMTLSSLLEDNPKEAESSSPHPVRSVMTITERVQQQFFVNSPSTSNRPTVVRLPLTIIVKYSMKDKTAETKASSPPTVTSCPRRKNLWSVEEHNRFLLGLELYPRGPWKCIASVVRTKTTRQTMTHTQKYRQKIERNLKTNEKVSLIHGPDPPRRVGSSDRFPMLPVLERPPPRWTDAQNIPMTAHIGREHWDSAAVTAIADLKKSSMQS